MWCLVPSVLDLRPSEIVEIPNITTFFRSNFPDIGNAALEFLNRNVGKGRYLASDHFVFISHDKCNVYLLSKDLTHARLRYSLGKVEHYAFLEDSNILYYTRAQSLELLYIETGIALWSVTGRSPFFHPSKKQTFYWFVEGDSFRTVDFFRHISKGLRLFLSLLTLQGVVNGTIISAATVFSLLPELCETVGEEDISP